MGSFFTSLIANILPGAYSLWPGALAIPAAMLPDTLPIEISTRNFQGMFLRVKEHHS